MPCIVARGAMQGTADAAAFSFMELARIPVLGLEAGQFRHGPFEMIDAKYCGDLSARRR
jgi:fructoselysine-6-P-deglycase FrlB-like protein